MRNIQVFPAFSLLMAFLPLYAIIPAPGQAVSKPNILFITIDDLRPELPSYGQAHIIAPNISKLAEEGVQFDRHYVQVPTCGAARYSLLSGLRPNSAQSRGNSAATLFPRTNTGKAISIPHLFKLNGYKTVSVGKITHSPNGRLGDKGEGDYELPQSWDTAYLPLGQYAHAWDAMHGYAGGVPRNPGSSPLTEMADVPDEGYLDGLVAQSAIAELNRLKAEPFFLAVGFFKPHLPFACPKKYWDLYQRNQIELSPYKEATKNVDLDLSSNKSGEFGRYKSPSSMTDAVARELRHGYFACVSYVDSQVGKVLDEVKRLGLESNTHVVLWGDHGFHLGDLDTWAKHNVWEFSLHSPLIIKGPGLARGRKAPGIVESLDIYPTLADLAGLTPPDLDGESFAPLLKNPALPGKNAAFGYYARGNRMVETVRDERYRFSRWRDGNQELQVELYDHETDPGETVNVAGNAQHSETLKKMRALLSANTSKYPAGNPTFVQSRFRAPEVHLQMDGVTQSSRLLNVLTPGREIVLQAVGRQHPEATFKVFSLAGKESLLVPAANAANTWIWKPQSPGLYFYQVVTGRE